jgi:hypothetical protein
MQRLYCFQITRSTDCVVCQAGMEHKNGVAQLNYSEIETCVRPLRHAGGRGGALGRCRLGVVRAYGVGTSTYAYAVLHH